mmetsp:Transcript_926/g.1451  ORF Transcript_926/g.1451 Transcript_926/m.1451 type:complete len:142 (+) Transcript_926:288-713(+)
MGYYQHNISIRAPKRGYHLITDKIEKKCEKDLKKIKIGMANVFIQHTSAGLTINENADPTVRKDFEAYYNDIVPENKKYYKHTMEGPDDITAHLKSSMIGCSINIPITNGRLNVGTWQGIYLCEFRNYPTERHIVITLQGE